MRGDTNWIYRVQTKLKLLRKGQSKLIVIASNCPSLRKTELEYYSMLARCNVHLFNGNNLQWVLPAVNCTELESSLSQIQETLTFSRLSNIKQYSKNEVKITSSPSIMFLYSLSHSLSLFSTRLSGTRGERCHSILITESLENDLELMNWEFGIPSAFPLRKFEKLVLKSHQINFWSLPTIMFPIKVNSLTPKHFQRVLMVLGCFIK